MGNICFYEKMHFEEATLPTNQARMQKSREWGGAYIGFWLWIKPFGVDMGGK